MNIFLIPSWYPSKQSPISGIFTKEQTMMMAEEHHINYYLSIIETFTLSPKRIIYSLLNYIKYFFFKQKYIIVNDYYIENIQPVLSWSYKYKEGNIKKQIELHTQFFQKLLKKGRKIDIIHAHVAYPAGYIAYKLSKKFNIPYIITEHMSPFPFDDFIKNKKINLNFHMALNHANRIVSVSESQKQEILEYTNNEIIVIPNFIDEDNYKVFQKKESKKIKFLTVGGLNEQKGIDILLKSISKLRLNNFNVQFDIVGDGDKREEYIKLVKDLGIGELVNFHGQIVHAEIMNFFNDCDVFILPSRHESFGVVYIEALAMGKPIIATKCGGPETIINEENGILIDKEDVNALVDTILYMKQNYTNYDSFVIRKDFLRRFSKKVNTKMYKDLYEKVLECVE